MRRRAHVTLPIQLVAVISMAYIHAKPAPGVSVGRSGNRLSDKHGIHLVTERYNCHGAKGVCRGENVVEATSRAAMEELIAPIGGNMTGSADSNSHSRTT